MRVCVCVFCVYSVSCPLLPPAQKIHSRDPGLDRIGEISLYSKIPDEDLGVRLT